MYYNIKYRLVELITALFSADKPNRKWRKDSFFFLL